MVFTGIIQEKARITKVEKLDNFSQIEIVTSSEFTKGIKVGASVSIDGVCLTVTSINGKNLTFDIIVETLNVTTLVKLKVSDLVNLERAARLGDEIGGHIISDMELARMTEEEKDKAYREEGLGDTFEFDKNCRAMSRYHNHRMGVLRLSEYMKVINDSDEIVKDKQNQKYEELKSKEILI